MNTLFHKPIMIGCLLMSAWGVTSLNKGIAEGSGYYEVPDLGRPASVFSLCCCKKEDSNINQTFYSCKLIDNKECPDETKQYNVITSQCPASLMFLKYREN